MGLIDGWAPDLVIVDEVQRDTFVTKIMAGDPVSLLWASGRADWALSR